MQKIIFWGKVRTGAKRGKSFGFPTANIRLHKKIPEGIYVSDIRYNKTTYPSATFIGSPIQFNEKDYKAEVHILHFNKNIYGKWITVRLYKKIRNNQKFAGEKELIQQMKRDLEEVKEYFKQL